MRSGLVLLELMMVLALGAIAAAMAIPRVAAWSDATAARQEAGQVVSAVDAARGAAMRLGSVAALSLTDTAYRVTAVVGGDTVLAWRRTGPRVRQVTIAGAGASIEFGPAGVALGVANRTITLSKGSATERVVLSKLGRITD